MIYIITNKLNGHQYIGKTSQSLDERWYQHQKAAEYKSQTYLHRAMRKHGVENFSCDYMCEGLDDEEVIMIENKNPKYNMTAGGDGGDTSNSPNFKKAMLRRNYLGENNPNYGNKGPLNPKWGKRYGPKPNISRSKMKKLLSSDGKEFLGFQEMWNYYGVKSYFSLKKLGITWSEIKDEKD